MTAEDLRALLEEKLTTEEEWWNFEFPLHEVTMSHTIHPIDSGFFISQIIRVLPKAEGQ